MLNQCQATMWTNDDTIQWLNIYSAVALSRGQISLKYSQKTLHSFIDILPPFLQWSVQYHVILDHVKTALDCMFITKLGINVLIWKTYEIPFSYNNLNINSYLLWFITIQNEMGHIPCRNLRDTCGTI